MKKEKECFGLCHRCEHRVRNTETGTWQPRYECGTKGTVVSCYMYKPVAPVVLQVQKGDDRPVGGPAMIAARMNPAEDQDTLREKLTLKMIEVEKDKLAYVYVSEDEVKNEIEKAVKRTIKGVKNEKAKTKKNVSKKKTEVAKKSR